MQSVYHQVRRLFGLRRTRRALQAKHRQAAKQRALTMGVPFFAGVLFYMEGFTAYADGVGLFRNPYQPDSYRFVCWQRGWFAALATSPTGANSRVDLLNETEL